MDRHAADAGRRAEAAGLSTSPTAESRPWPIAAWFVTGAIVIGLLWALAVGSAESETFVLLLVLAAVITYLARAMVTPLDQRWLSSLIIWGWTVKMLAATARYVALELLYGGTGDATGYHNFGIRYAPLWRSFQPPEFGTGTEFVQWLTGLVYVPNVPTKLGGFLIFAMLAFLGQLLLYAAFRRALPSPRVKWYAVMIFFFPNILYWPSSLGKESLMLLFIGAAAYAAVRLFAGYRLRWLVLFGVALAACGVIRSHIALLMAVALVVVLLISRGPEVDTSRWARATSVVVVVLMSVLVVRYVAADFDIDISSGISQSLLEEEIDPILANVEDQTDRGGSAVEGTAIRSIIDIPEAVLRVVFRPLPTDAHNPQALVNSLVEGTLLLALFIWRAPAIARNLVRHWRDPYILFSLLFTAGFVIGHSAVLNLGIIARQRSQAIPFILVLLIELGKRPESGPERPSTTGTDDAEEEFVPWPTGREATRVPAQEFGGEWQTLGGPAQSHHGRKGETDMRTGFNGQASSVD